MKSFPNNGNIGDDAWLPIAIDTVKSSTIVRMMPSPHRRYIYPLPPPFAKCRIPVSIRLIRTNGLRRADDLYKQTLTSFNSFHKSRKRFADFRQICTFVRRFNRISYLPDLTGPAVKCEKINRPFLSRFIDRDIRRRGLNRDQHL